MPIVKQHDWGTSFTDREYSLHVENIASDPDMGKVFFYTGVFHKNLRLPKTELPITGRSFPQYVRKRKDLVPINPRYQYVDVGAGLGEFVPALVTRFGKLNYRPIIIDPANYRLMKEILTYAHNHGTSSQKTIEAFLKRIDLITNPKLVRLINMKLGEAVETYPKLHGTADVVVDMAGPSMYCETEIHYGDKKLGLRDMLIERVKGLEKILLK